MKKLLALALLASALGLASCGETTRSEYSEEETSDSFVADWDEIAKSQYHQLTGDGNDLPYFDFEAHGLNDATSTLSTFGTGSDAIYYFNYSVKNCPYSLLSEVKAFWLESTVFAESTGSEEGIEYLLGTYSDGTSIDVELSIVDSNGDVITAGTGTFNLDVQKHS